MSDLSGNEVLLETLPGHWFYRMTTIPVAEGLIGGLRRWLMG